MPLCVVGSVALDSVETPTEKRENVLGGSAVFFSYAASFFTTVRLAGVVGEDWPRSNTATCSRPAASTRPACRSCAGGKTFRWRGKYLENMNDRETLDLQLNVLADFDPVLPEPYRRSKFLFLANGSTVHQLQGARSMHRGRRWSWPTRWTITSAPSPRAESLVEAARRAGA